MKIRPPDRSPRYPETTHQQVREGYCTDSQTPEFKKLQSPFILPGPGTHRLPDTAERSRFSPVVWEAKAELSRMGYLSLPLKTSSPLPIDLVAWDRQTLCFIAVRRIRTVLAHRAVQSRFSTLIADLQAVNHPITSEIQLWIRVNSTFRVYTIYPGGLMRGNLP